MVKNAQKSLPQGKIYQLNEQRLSEVGTDKLQVMLETRDWSALPIFSLWNKNKS